MAASKKCWPLSTVTDDARWNAADLFGRLCLVADAAFLSAGFQPCAAPPSETTPWSVSRRYSVPQLAHREGADAALLRVSRRGRRRGGCGGGKIEVDAHVDCNGLQRNARRERLPLAALAPVLSGAMDDTARALTTPDDDANGAAGGAWLWRLLADQLGRRLFLSICRHGGLPVLPGFACLPVDLQVTILRRLRAAEDLARLECAGRELRRLVADHDAVLWKAKYEGFIRFHNSGFKYISSEERGVKPPPFFADEDMALMSWKERYAMSRWQAMVRSAWRFGFGSSPMPTWKPRVPPAYRARLQTITDMVRRRCAQRNPPPQHHDRPADQPRTVTRTSSDHGWRGTTIVVEDRSSRRTMSTVVLSKPYRKGNGAGAVHSPSSRHRWNHR